MSLKQKSRIRSKYGFVSLQTASAGTGWRKTQDDYTVGLVKNLQQFFSKVFFFNVFTDQSQK